MKPTLLLAAFIGMASMVLGQAGTISGKVFGEGEPLEFANVQLSGATFGAVTDSSGSFQINGIPYGTWTVVVTYTSFEKAVREIILSEDAPVQNVDFTLSPAQLLLGQVVVTGTRTFKRQAESPVIVNVIGSETLDDVQACNLAEGLKFQPGLRVETDCQTCNYTQLRMNGLGGGYSQILINGRPIFSPLTGLYGMEQVPTNMIERIEVVRGGGSALYGSSAIGGTVNVITKIPKKSGYNLGYTHQKHQRRS